ncbi:MAG TPA: formate dehydrogenase subunit delta [Acidiphilium sp.]|nr:MAG: formate dehydrogenase [Acidiphilium sp. 21-60-14]OYV89886.1 MAG: formate dehydrogenase [Acidiphilium sp. 37-60-79]OZB39455.1 MAG: formate dehydrogenase [Acidiphilium sp. 34-60-192]HQT88208.1 formate dehydrogenase subunit delta [Acidiphilium sp.]HQU23414.1 formate dehydrogenase subunit delta [Acidiphilium sp.]
MSHEQQDQKLVYMANQIATFFASRPEDEAVAEITNHLRKFWEPRMRAKIIDFTAHGGAGLMPRAEAAVKMLSKS